jgi:uncharacterized protein
MSSAAFDPLHLTVEAFAKQGGVLAGDWPLSTLPRLQESTHMHTHTPSEGEAMPVVAWQLRGESRSSRAGPPEIWLHVQSSADVALTCQRCLQPVTEHISAQRSFRFVHGEATAAELDAQSEDDVLALSRFLDARDLTEDELLLTLPLVPRHEVCPQPLVVFDTTPSPGDDAEQEHPFAALARLKRDKLLS